MMKLLLKSLLRFINKLSVVASFSEMVMSTRFITRECVYHPRVHTESDVSATLYIQCEPIEDPCSI